MSKLLTILLACTISLSYCQAPAEPLPVGFIPGLGDLCLNLNTGFIPQVKKHTPGNNKMFCIDSGPSLMSIFSSFDSQIDRACRILTNEMKDKYDLEKGFILVGLSQGGLIARAVLQECEMGKYVKKIITLGGPHEGVAAVPHTGKDIFSNIINFFADRLAYLWIAQKLVGPAGYFHRIDKEDVYFKSGVTLARLNNAGEKKNDTYNDRLSQLEAFVMVQFSEDTMIEPKETAHFGFYKDGKKSEIVDMADGKSYNENLTALQKLHADGKLHFDEFQGEHLSISMAELEKSVIPFF